MPNPINVMHVCETSKGGIATYLRLILRVMEKTTRNRVILPDDHLAEVGNTTQAAVFADPGRGVYRLWRLIQTTRGQLRSESPDILFFHSTFTLPILAALKLLGVSGRYIYCAHGWAALRYPANSLKRCMVAGIEGTLCGFADTVINVSIQEHAYAQAAHYRGKHVLIENAVAECEDVSLPAPFNRDEPNINLLFIGRFDRQKGLDILLDAFVRARRLRPDLRLHVVGEAVLDASHAAHKQRDLTDVAFYGWQTPAGVQGFYEAADMLVVPSRWEGFGLVVPEAFRAGTPVKVSDKGALPGLVEEGITGLIIPLQVEAFSNALIMLDKAQLRAMRPACRKCFEQRFHSDRFERELGQLYEDLLHDGQ